MIRRSIFVFVLLVARTPGLPAQTAEDLLAQKIDGLRALTDVTRPAATRAIALEIRSLQAGDMKVRLADELARLSTEGDEGHATLQTVADTLAAALQESPQPLTSDGTPAMPYMDLAQLVHYEGVKTATGDAMLAQAQGILAVNDADVAKADFTLMDMRGRTYKLSALKGKVVVVNFWATWCPPCRKEMADLDAIYARYKANGLVVLSLTSEEPGPVISYLSSVRYRPPVLIDADGTVAKEFHVASWPRTFVFDRRGKLVSVAIDMRTRRQFFDMLALAGMKSTRRR